MIGYLSAHNLCAMYKSVFYDIGLPQATLNILDIVCNVYNI